ncbi:hypothetical protein N474_21570 [Pseudoalteromonas luteoviolacea CPMOR-2]|uniref:Glutamate 5-kinase n=1 Tax=Pseudoalteromonas luteoviolacea DSM 6061 TaxID=1365250 RepID=A0A166XKR2_9GAMM|nr:glutamate 5-kinase [Pseudoalteromonas luteoviolacea]KZN40489.1 hypothetical protein N475_11970 [Pseudoalteromonas luteoviolacea DSM 6061]KZN53114.1 hypothetical protein N474_21570 [Pseudoalteromonas luteoviolacea CPMOR-2]MBE0387358.1 glutamate 5-kinase [Pseudoalteromonas luteoviolacea DSM 6061]
MTKRKVIVVKLGTSVLTAGSLYLNKPRLVDLARQCVELKNLGWHVVLVSSGAVAAGRAALDNEVGNSVAEKQMLAAIGQGQLIHLWQSLFSLFDIPVAQLLLTRADVEDRSRYLNARDTLDQLLAHNVVPIVNENDAVATSEIKVGDNDNLSALVAILANADRLLLLTDQSGLFTADPRNNPDARLIERVDEIDEEIIALAGGSGTSLGTGGMATKLQAAQIAQRAGIETVIAKGAEPNVILNIQNDILKSTKVIRFDAPLDGRKKWLLSGPRCSGAIICDQGAVVAVSTKGASLLAKGVTDVSGQFSRGDLIELKDLKGRVIARGLIAFDHKEMQSIKGLHSAQINEALGYQGANVVIHRDDLVLLDNVAT